MYCLKHVLAIHYMPETWSPTHVALLLTILQPSPLWHNRDTVSNLKTKHANSRNVLYPTFQILL